MKITWLGHSCFKLEESTGTSVIADPYSKKIVKCDMPQVSCDIVTLSNKDMLYHNVLKNILGKPKVICEEGFLDYKGIHISGLLVDQKSKRSKDNLVYIYRMDGVDICHLGSIKVEEKVQIIDSIGCVNVLIIPIGGGNYSIDAKEAKDYVDMLMPDIVIPMLYRDKDFTLVNLDKLEEFTDLFDDKDLIYIDQNNAMEFDRADFEGDNTKVVIFENSLK